MLLLLFSFLSAYFSVSHACVFLCVSFLPRVCVCARACVYVCMCISVCVSTCVPNTDYVLAKGKMLSII